MICKKTFDLNAVLLIDDSNFQLISKNEVNWEEYDHRPLIVFGDLNIARKRYEEWI